MNQSEIQTQITEGYSSAANWGISYASGLMALLSICALLGFLLRKYSS